MTVKIVAAQVFGKNQKRTALGMMAAYIAMNPKITIEELNEKFPMKVVCPDAGIDKLFFTEEEYDQKNTKWFVDGIACVIKDDEALRIADNQKVLFNATWSKDSLYNLQNEMEKYAIKGSVDTQRVSESAKAGYEIHYTVVCDQSLFLK